ncbi:MAG TPA: VWA domain-containing protein [Flavobacteriales bacterium]|nr:VWA domain-containing protein [Flavobacteriales bacterium]
MRNCFARYFFLLAAGIVPAQWLFSQKNLVPNPGFEEEKPGRPSRTFNTIYSPGYPLVKHWVTPTAGSSDYYNSDQSTVWGTPVKKARSGQGRAGIIAKPTKATEYTEYTTTKLSEPLVEDKLYQVKMYYSLDKRCIYYASSIGINFTADYYSVNNTQTLPLKPQLGCTDRAKNSTCEGWVELSGVYKAYGGEQYLTIGCFDTKLSIPVTGREHYKPKTKLEAKGHFDKYAYYYIDDVCVTEITDDPFCQLCCKTMPKTDQPYNNFIFMVDISSSMYDGGYISDVKKSVIGFVDSLGKNDQVSIVTFDGNSHILARKLYAHEKDSISQLMGSISVGTSTNVNKAINTAYGLLDSIYISHGNNCVVLVSDAGFELSKASSKTIQQWHKNKHVTFTMVQYGNRYNKTLEKVCHKTNGNYNQAKKEPVERILNQQIKHDHLNDYTPEDKNASRFKIVQTNTFRGG